MFIKGVIECRLKDLVNVVEGVSERILKELANVY